MLTYEEAKGNVEKALISKIPGTECVVRDDLRVELSECWVFYYNSRKWLETGNLMDALAGNGPVAVGKSDGAVIFCRPFSTHAEIAAEFERSSRG